MYGKKQRTETLASVFVPPNVSAPPPPRNTLVDWNKIQGYTHATDSHVQPRRDLNTRYITIENSSERPVSFAITTYCCEGPLPVKQYTLVGGQIISVGINPPGEAQQYIYIIDPVTGAKIGLQTALRTDCNSFVLRDGLQGWFVQFFKRAEYRAAF